MCLGEGSRCRTHPACVRRKKLVLAPRKRFIHRFASPQVANLLVYKRDKLQAWSRHHFARTSSHLKIIPSVVQIMSRESADCSRSDAEFPAKSACQPARRN